VFRAFTDSAAMAKRLPPNGFTCQAHRMDVREGGTFRMSFTNFANGQAHAFGGKYLEVAPGRRLRYTDVFDDPNLPGEMVTTVTFEPVSCGTALTVVQDGIPAAIPLEACYLGWQESLVLLGKLVEIEVTG
jgi:uncharacterized protein YndB with AHSA1/START domain